MAALRISAAPRTPAGSKSSIAPLAGSIACPGRTRRGARRSSRSHTLPRAVRPGRFEFGGILDRGAVDPHRAALRTRTYRAVDFQAFAASSCGRRSARPLPASCPRIDDAAPPARKKSCRCGFCRLGRALARRRTTMHRREASASSEAGHGTSTGGAAPLKVGDSTSSSASHGQRPARATPQASISAHGWVPERWR